MSHDYHLAPLANPIHREGPVVLLILDGYGIGKNEAKENPIVAANPVVINELVHQAKEHHLYTRLKAHGPAVGLPSESDMGNSEVGHNAFGCGQIYSQGTKLVDESFASGVIFRTPQWHQVVAETAAHNGTLHMFGLLSDGNIHSHMNQIFKLLDGAVESGIHKIRMHVLLDGRDVSPTSGLVYINQLEEKLAKLREHNVDARIATGGGRMYVTMDRYGSDWKMVQRGWELMVHGVVMPEDVTSEYSGYFRSATEAIELGRRLWPAKQDQYNPPFVVVDEAGQPIGRMQDGDAVINWNFRGDRAVQITQTFTAPDAEFTHFARGAMPRLTYAGLLEYDTEVHIPRLFLVPPPEIHHTMGQYLCASGVTSYAVAETHKYGHVTFFWNGNKSGCIDEHLEQYDCVESLPNAQTESHPEMKAPEVTDKLVEAIRSGRFRFVRCNLANPDMVGHTGNFQSCVRAVQCMNQCVERVAREVEARGGILIITADHGNVEIKDNKGSKTSHTCAPVDFAVRDFAYHGEYTLLPEGQPTADADGLGAGLSNVAATVMNMLGFEAPAVYRKSLYVPAH
ncbi:bisphosphoglycerate independent phosphoglycerate mutase [Paratrimastix pyriformis]|uniref:phosphoglycerate mutase (2,3-diphosphoglycerate-independent) n=1 Tax=Paratrimastix pyriformis TaxID=342808 RepID=A0SNX3_9EUKA|nr:2,3-bisphosphoglycerate-independent phosphoglyerate mutase [Paratrimastix pyriformis]KAJ4460590.1 bisphosphoglycerate independent phosphoglycerate mutase [Paratrimastix pyriformis]|eukprot:GAFH01001113.1.p2 GENE.GAFH01001113.1~~GAFH01001113.1.p2  ORF type:complete len:576 (-),score=214.81 GAFH01001113.1:225-1928(-)